MTAAIEVRGLGKRYQLGVTHTDLLSEKLGSGIRALGQRFGWPARSAPTNHICTPTGDSFWALREVEFDVQPGEVIGIIGRNGAGKSTLLKILSRITAPTTGEIRLSGRVASLLEVGTGFHPELTGRENIYLNGAILGMSRKEIGRKFDEIVAFAEVEKFIDTPVKRYSSGMYVRLAFAVAAHLEPEILLVDEVLAVGDLAFQKKCLNKMEDVSGEGRSVLFVSHNMASIKRLCGSAVVLEGGRVRLKAKAHEAVTEYYRNQDISNPRVHFSSQQHRIRTKIQIETMAMVSQSDTPIRQAYADQPIKFTLGIRTEELSRDVRVGFALYREGVLVSNMHSEPMDFHAYKNPRQVHCQLPADLLLPGFYDVHVGAHDARTGRGFDWIPDAFNFQIMDVKSTEFSHLDERDRGLVKIQPRWTTPES